MKERLQLTRACALRQLYGSQVIAISAAFVRRRLRREEPELVDLSESEANNALFFLKGQKFCEEVRDEATGEIKYRITSAGILEFERGEQ